MSTFDDARIREILLGRRNVRVYPLPFAPELRAGVRVLSEAEIDAARIEAQRYCKSVKADLDVDPDFLERETRRQIIWRSFVDADDRERPLFASDKQVRELDTEMVRALFDLYHEHHAWVSPLRTLTKEQTKELADALGKAEEPRVILIDCDSDSLRNLCISLASALRAS